MTGSDAQPAEVTDSQPPRSTYTAPDFAAFSEILERPLFSEGRTPPEEPAVQQAAVNYGQQTQLALRLEGITDRDILDLNLIVAHMNYVNRVALGLGVKYSEHDTSA